MLLYGICNVSTAEDTHAEIRKFTSSKLLQQGRYIWEKCLPNQSVLQTILLGHDAQLLQPYYALFPVSWLPIKMVLMSQSKSHQRAMCDISGTTPLFFYCLTHSLAPLGQKITDAFTFSFWLLFSHHLTPFQHNIIHTSTHSWLNWPTITQLQ